MDNTDLLWFIPSMFVATFTIPFIITMKLLAYFSGWERLAEDYSCHGVFDGKIYHRQSARIKWTSYKGCLKVGVGDQGLYLAQIWMFSLFHKPILIPWNELEVEPYDKFVLDGCIIRLLNEHELTIFLHGNLFQNFPVPMEPELK